MPPIGTGWKQILFDDFLGSSLNGADWTVDDGNATDGYAGSHYRAANVSVADSILTLRNQGAANAYDGCQVRSKHPIQYGYFETKLKYRNLTAGHWGSPWLWTVNGGPQEYDLCETRGTYPTITTFNIHGDFGAMNGANITWDPSVWHVAAVDWSPSRAIFYLDGVEQYRDSTAADQLGAAMIWMLNYKVGGGGWQGSPDGSSIFPGYLDVDYVAAWQREDYHSYYLIEITPLDIDAANEATFKAALLELGHCYGETRPGIQSHLRGLTTQKYVLEYVGPEALSQTLIADALYRKLGQTKANMIANLSVTEAAGADYAARRISALAW